MSRKLKRFWKIFTCSIWVTFGLNDDKVAELSYLLLYSYQLTA